MRALLIIAIAACSSPKKAEPVLALAGDVVIENVTIVPMNRDGTVPGQTVIVRGDKIAAIAPSKDVDAKAAATRVDGKGKWLMPGLADMHIHTWNENDLTMFVVAGVTTVRNMYGSDQHLAWKKDIAAGKRFGPTLFTGSPILDGDPPVWPGSIVMTKPDDVDNIVAGLKTQGYDFLKPYARLEKPVYDALVAAGKKHGLTLQGHVPRAIDLQHALASGQKSIEHLDGWLEALAPKDTGANVPYWKRLAALVASADETKVPALANETKKAGTWNCATLIVMSRLAALEDVPALEKQVKWLSYIAPEVRATWNPKADFRMSSADASDYAAMRAANKLRANIVRTLATSGAPLIVGTDTGNPYVVAGESMHDEIELMVAAGAPRARVLRAATADAATFLGDTAGIVAVGARADLVLVGVDPLTQPLPLVPDGVVLRGQWLPKTELEAKLAAITAKPAVTDRFADMKPLVPEGKNVIEAHYEIRAADKVIGEERLAIGLVNNDRVVVAQEVVDSPGRMEIVYRIDPDATKMDVKTPFGALSFDAKVQNGKLVATGTDVAGKPIALSEAMPKDAFISAPGVGGTVFLVSDLDGLRVGETGKSTSIELGFFPQPKIEIAKYNAERKPDVDGNIVYAIKYELGGQTIDSELHVKDDIPIKQTFGAPIDMSFVRVK